MRIRGLYKSTGNEVKKIYSVDESVADTSHADNLTVVTREYKNVGHRTRAMENTKNIHVLY